MGSPGPQKWGPKSDPQTPKIWGQKGVKIDPFFGGQKPEKNCTKFCIFLQKKDPFFCQFLTSFLGWGHPQVPKSSWWSTFRTRWLLQVVFGQRASRPALGHSFSITLSYSFFQLPWIQYDCFTGNNPSDTFILYITYTCENVLGYSHISIYIICHSKG